MIRNSKTRINEKKGQPVSSFRAETSFRMAACSFPILQEGIFSPPFVLSAQARRNHTLPIQLCTWLPFPAAVSSQTVTANNPTKTTQDPVSPPLLHSVKRIIKNYLYFWFITCVKITKKSLLNSFVIRKEAFQLHKWNESLANPLMNLIQTFVNTSFLFHDPTVS